MNTLKSIKSEIKKEIELTKEFFAEIDRKQVDSKKLAAKLQSTPEETEVLKRLFEELTK
jgi:hypothetical protein